MVKIFIIFLIAIFAIGLLVSAAVLSRSRKGIDHIDSQYYDEEGNHLYYDRSIIEKEEFRRANPEAGRYVRTLRRLFRRN